MEIFRPLVTITIIAIFLNTKESGEIEIKTEYCWGDDNGDKIILNCSVYPSIFGHIEITKSQGIIGIQCSCIATDESILNWPQIFQGLNFTTSQPKLELAQIEDCISIDIPFSEIFKMLRIPVPSNISFYKSTRSVPFSSYHFKNLHSVQKLNLSNTYLHNLLPDLLQGLPNLKELYLSMNEIQYIPETFLQYCPQLRLLDLSFNEIIIMPPKMFKYTTNLKILSLSNNNFILRKYRFEYLQQLETLDLSSFGAFYLDVDLFYYLKNLKEIDLSHNHLTYITQGLFDNLKLLEIVDISENSLKILPEKLFNRCERLEEINIGRNKLRNLTGNIFKGLVSLRTLDISFNELKSLNKSLLNSQENLRKLHIQGNVIIDLPENLFNGCERLEEINMEKNKLKYLPGNVFKDLMKLRTLDISFNELETLNESLFDSQENLRELSLNNNNLTTIKQSVFSKLRNLEILKLDFNRLKKIEYGSFHNLTNLRTASFSSNALTFQETSEYSFLQKCLNLEELDMGCNHVNRIYDDWPLTKLRKFKLSSNKFKTISAEELIKFAPGVTIDLTFNEIQSVDFRKLESLASTSIDTHNVSLQCETTSCNEQVADQKVHVKLGNNPIVCDCKSYHFISYIQRQMKPSAYQYLHIDEDELFCHDILLLLVTDKVQNIDLNLFTCPINEIVDQPVDCVPNCDCFFRLKDDALLIDCQNKSFTKMPAIIPSAPYIKLTVLDLKNNEIQYLDNMDGFNTITQLNLSNNKISQINPSITFSNLTVLQLDNNELTNLDEQILDVLSQNEKLKVLTLHGNPWKCEDCAAKKLYDFLVKQQEIVLNITDIKCDDKMEHQIFTGDLCQELQIGYVSISIAMFGITIGAMIAFYYRYQHEIHVWLYAHNTFLWLVTEEELDRSKKYDAFISYSHLDEDFIVESLVPELERGPHPFKLCLHFRDWIVGEWIPNQIVRSVEESRRTIVVLSPNFLNSVWGKMEFRTAHVTALNEGRARVIIIMYKELGPIEKLDAELAAYLKMNTYAKWGDPRFWDKLRYALPHHPKL